MKMFKKSLIAASVAALAGTAVADINTTQESFSLEGTIAAGTISINSATGAPAEHIGFNFTTEEDYNAGDALTFTVTGAAIADAEDAAIDVVGAGTNDFVQSALTFDAEAGTISFRIPQAVGAGSTITLNGVELDASALTASTEINIATRAQVAFAGSFVSVDQFNADVAEFKSQFGPSEDVSGFAGIVDVESSRKSFVTAAGDSVASDSATVAFVNDTSLLNAVVLEEVTHTIMGSSGFSWFNEWSTVDEETGERTYTLTDAASVTSSNDDFELSLSEDLMSLTIAQTAVGTVDTTVGVTLNAPGTDSEESLVEQSFSASVVASAGEDDYTIYNGANFGQWTLNGASVSLPFYPIGSGITQFVYVANSGSQEATIEFTALSNSGEPVSGTLDLKAAPNGVTSINTSLRRALDEAGLSGDRLQITLTIQAPEDNIEVFGGYNSRGDRVRITN